MIRLSSPRPKVVSLTSPQCRPTPSLWPEGLRVVVHAQVIADHVCPAIEQALAPVPGDASSSWSYAPCCWTRKTTENAAIALSHRLRSISTDTPANSSGAASIALLLRLRPMRHAKSPPSTASAGSFDAKTQPDAYRCHLRRYPRRVALLGRFALATSRKRRRVGAVVLADGLRRIAPASGVMAVDASWWTRWMIERPICIWNSASPFCRAERKTLSLPPESFGDSSGS